MAKAVMDFHTILESTGEMQHFGDLLQERIPTLSVNNEETDELGFAVCVELEDLLRTRVKGEVLTAARFKEIVHEAIEEMRTEIVER